MQFPALFAVPTYNRPQTLQSFVSEFTANFEKYGHDQVPILVLDDSVGPWAERNIDAIRAGKTKKVKALYLGESEKGKILNLLIERTGIARPLLNRVLRTPSYGGNRNWQVLCTVGEKVITCDDDMRPFGVLLKEHTPLLENEICKGAFLRRDQLTTGAYQHEYDQIGEYLRYLGHRVAEVPAILSGDVPRDVESEESASLQAAINGEVHLTGVKIKPRAISETSHIRFAIPHLCGDGDIDSEDIIVNFMKEGTEDLLRGKEEYKFTISSFQPALTKESWRLTPTFLGYDNRGGLIPFAPTNYRFEDFVYRIYAAQHPEVVSAYVNSVQTHERSLETRATIVLDFFNESVARIMKNHLLCNVRSLTDHQILFESEIEVTTEAVQRIIDRGKGYYDRLKQIKEPSGPQRQFMFEMKQCLDGFRDVRRLQHYIQRQVEAEIKDINLANEIWPDLLGAMRQIAPTGIESLAKRID